MNVKKFVLQNTQEKCSFFKVFYTKLIGRILKIWTEQQQKFINKKNAFVKRYITINLKTFNDINLTKYFSSIIRALTDMT